MIQYIKYETILIYFLFEKIRNVCMGLEKLFGWERICGHLWGSEYVPYIVCEGHGGFM